MALDEDNRHDWEYQKFKESSVTSGEVAIKVINPDGSNVAAGSGGTASADDADFTQGTTQGTPAMGVYESVPTSVTDNDMGIMGIDANRNLKVSIEVDNAGIGGGTQYAVDAALGATPTGTLALTKRDDALSALTPAEGDAVELRVDANGALWVIPSGTVTVDATDLDIRDLTSASDSVEAIQDTAEDLNMAPATSVVDSGNSTTTPLGGGATFTGTGFDCTGYSNVTITLYADVDSGTDGMQFQFSTDNTNWDDVYSFNMDVSDSDTRRFQFPVTARYFRVVYTNGAGAQSAFRVQTMVHRSNILTSIHRVDGTVTGDRSVQLMKSTIIGETTAGGGGFVNVKVNPSGALTVEATSDDADNLLVNANLQVGDADVDNANPVPISDAGGSITVDGAVTVSATDLDIRDLAFATDSVTVHQSVAASLNMTEVNSAAILADTANIDINMATVAGAVSGTEMQVDVVTMPTVTVTATDLDIRDLTSVSDSVAAVQSGTWNINNISGTVSLPTGASTSANQSTMITHLSEIEGAVETIEGAVSGSEMQVDVVGALPAGTNLLGRVSGSHETSTIYNGTTALTPKFAVISATTNGDNTIVSAVASKKIRVIGGLLMADGDDVDVRFESGASGTALTGRIPLVTSTGFQIPYAPCGNFETATNTLLNLEITGTPNVYGWLMYVEV